MFHTLDPCLTVSGQGMDATNSWRGPQPLPRKTAIGWMKYFRRTRPQHQGRNSAVATQENASALEMFPPHAQPSGFALPFISLRLIALSHRFVVTAGTLPPGLHFPERKLL